jgi:hypothetical protein
MFYRRRSINARDGLGGSNNLLRYLLDCLVKGETDDGLGYPLTSSCTERAAVYFSYESPIGVVEKPRVLR